MHPAQAERRVRLAAWRMCSKSTPVPTIPASRRSAWTRRTRNCSARCVSRCPCAPGRPARHDPEYVRGGVANLFLVCEPLRGWRHVTVTERRTGVDWAHCVREMVDVHYPDAEKIVLVMDQLNTHTRRRSTRPSRPPRRNGSRTARDPPHAEAWQLAEYGGDRVQRAGAPMPGTAPAGRRRLRQEVGGWEARATRRRTGSTGASRRRMRGSTSNISIPSHFTMPSNVANHRCQTTRARPASPSRGWQGASCGRAGRRCR